MAWDRSEYWNESNYIAYDFIENNLAWFAEQLWTPTNYLDFSLAGRLEHSSTWNNHATWRFAGSWKVQGHKDASTRLLGSVGSGFRAPTDWERYADTYYGGYNYLGNPDLKISRSLGGDFGIEQRLFKNNHSAHYASLTGFWTRINDIIVADSSNYPVATWQNSDYGIVSGFEAQVYGEFKTAWETGYTVNYTYVMPRDNEGKQLTATARHTINAEIHTSPIDRLTFGVGMISALNRTNTYGTARLDDYVTFRLFAKYRVSDTVTLHCRLENLFDESYQVTQSPNISTPWYDASHPATQMSRGFGIYGGVTVDF
jgi:iron complex outermembrane receptor protein